MGRLYHNGTIMWPEKKNGIWEIAKPTAMSLNKGNARFGAFGDLRNSAEEIIDLEGRYLYPSLIDAHVHVQGTGQRVLNPRLEDCISIGEVIEIVRKIPPTNGWIVARGWDQNLWKNKSLPTRQDLDAAFPDAAIALVRVDGHVIWCNSKALALCRITSETADPLGGAILRDEAGNATGIVMDEAMKLIEDHAIQISRDKISEQLRAGLLEFSERGIKAVCDMGVKLEVWEVYKKLYELEGDSLPICHVFCDMNQESGRALFASRLSDHAGFNDSRHPNLRLIGPKLYLDGALGSRGAHLLEPYSDSGEPYSGSPEPYNDSRERTGLALSEDAFVSQTLRQSVSAGLQIAIHAIGDAAFRRAVDHYESAGIADSSAIGRIEHCQVAAQSDVERMKSFGIWAVVQPQFWTADRVWAAERLGSERMENAYRWKSFFETDCLAGSSDSPVEKPIIEEGIAAFTNRSGREALTSAEALAAYSLLPAKLFGSAPAVSIRNQPLLKTYEADLAL